ncbi:MAG: adenine deaminase, partial [Firmicutes bacterium]|nr:adenine deaminase [Bacillota bacterium]
PEDFAVPTTSTQKEATVNVIHLERGSTAINSMPLTIINKEIIADPDRDILWAASLDRHHRTHALGHAFVKGMGLRRGAVASTYDSHNGVVVGCTKTDMAFAVNRLVALGGGIVIVENHKVLEELPLPLAGLYSERPFLQVAEHLERLIHQIRTLGCALPLPFLTLASLIFPVLPGPRLTNRGIFDVPSHQKISLEV